jgi:carboxymethylenebutenolidase
MSEWNTFQTDGPVGITAEITTYSGGGDDEIHAYVARPTTPGPHPGAVVIHHMPGWDEFYQEFSERLARHGCIAIAPDLYCRFGHGAPDDVAAKARAEGGVHDDSVVADCEAALAWLTKQPGWNGKAGVIGSCSGGRHALLVASRVRGFDAIADLWGGGVVPSDQVNPARPVAPLEYTEQLETPLLGIFGNDDKNPTPEDVDIHEAELKKHGKKYEFHRYDGAGHGFFYYHAGAYRQEQAMDAWGKVFAFFERHLHTD